MVRPFLRAVAAIVVLSISLSSSVNALDKKDLKLKVLAGNSDLAYAQKIADQLNELGYNVSQVDHASRSNFTTSVIYYAKTFKSQAEFLAPELNILSRDIRPLTWRSEFNLIIVTANNPLSQTETQPHPREDIPSKPKAYSLDMATVNQQEENISFAIAEAHALFVNKEYPLASEKFQSVVTIITRAQKFCKSSVLKTRSEENKKITVQVLSKDENLDPAKHIAQRLMEKSYTVSPVEKALRMDLVGNAIYYVSAVKEEAEAIAAELDGTFSLLPLQWPSKFDMILVATQPGSEDIQIIELDEKLSQLHKKELQIKEAIDLLVYEAFDLLAAGSNCDDVQNKFEGIKTHLIRIEGICETANRLTLPISGIQKSSMEVNPEYLYYPETKTILNLEEAVAVAVANNTSIDEASEKLNAAIEQKKSAGADFLPKANFNYSYTRLNEAPTLSIPDISIPGLGAFGGDIPIGSQDVYTWNLTLSQPLFTGFGLLSQYEIKKLGIKTSEIQKKTTILNLVRNVKQAYYDLLLAQKLELVTQETVKNLRSHESDAEQFYNQGMIPYNDLLKAKVALANAVQENERTKALMKITMATLNVLLNYDVNQSLEVQDVSTIPSNSFQLSDLIHEAIENRPELELLSLGLTTLDQAIRATKSVYYPQVAIIGQYKQTGQDVLATENDFGEVESSTVTLQASWSLFKGGKTPHDIAKLEFDKRALVKQYEGAENGIELEVKNVFENLSVSKKNIKTAYESVLQAKENWRITTLQYQEQIATSTDVLDARTYLSQAELNYLRAHYGYMKSLADLEKALGKDYSSSSNEKDLSPELN